LPDNILPIGLTSTIHNPAENKKALRVPCGLIYIRPPYDRTPPSSTVDKAYVQPASRKADSSIIPHRLKNSDKFWVLNARSTISAETAILFNEKVMRAAFGKAIAKTAYKEPIDAAINILITLRPTPDIALASFKIKQFASRFSKNRRSAYITTPCLLSFLVRPRPTDKIKDFEWVPRNLVTS
jgi:hypothetical protein